MPNIIDLVVHLSGMRVNDNNRRRASTVAGHLAAQYIKKNGISYQIPRNIF